MEEYEGALIKKGVLLLFILLIAGCANPYAQFYKEIMPRDVLNSRFMLEDNPTILTGENVENDHLKMLENGYDILGASSFNGPMRNNAETEIIFHAKMIKAGIAIVYVNYSNTISDVMGFNMPTTQRSTTNFSGNVYGSKGFANFIGQSNTTVTGTQTMMMPYTVTRFDHLVTYWVKQKNKSVFGAFLKELPEEIKKQIGSNKGVYVIAVVKSSPAYNADILRGDVIKRIGGIDILDRQSFEKSMQENAGGKTTVYLIRDGKEISKEVFLNPIPVTASISK